MQTRHLLRTLLTSGLGLLLAALAATACKESKSSSKPSPSTVDPSVACVADNRGSWNGTSCTCTSGWSVDPTTSRCTVQTASAEAGCTGSGGSWSGTTCTCQANYTWNSSTNSCTSTGATTVAQPTQAQCIAAASTGAAWNGTACLCQNAAYPYWNASSFQCVTTVQPTTSTVGLVSQAQCITAATSGAFWNNNACQCTSASYPTWNPTTMQCVSGTSSITAAPATQSQCVAAASTGAFWNGTVCLCQNRAYPYWNASSYQCVAAAQSTTSPVGLVTQAQCLTSTATGAMWNGAACQCTSGTYPYWNSATIRCEATLPAGGTAINGQGACNLGQLSIQGQCVSMTSVTPRQGCEATGGTWVGLPGTCTCGAGYTWYAALNSCQNFPATGTSTTAWQQLCTLSGGQPGTNVGQCGCPTTSQVTVDPSTNFQYCATGNNRDLPDWLKKILGLFF